MSTDIYEKNGILATAFAGPKRYDDGERRMIQISGTEGVEGDGFVQLRPETLFAIAEAWRGHNDGRYPGGNEPDFQTLALEASAHAHDKRGLALIIDRVEALRVRIDSTDEDEEIQFNKEHWLALCREALAEAVKYRHAWDAITANLALALDESPDTVAAAVRTCVRDNETKEKRIAEMQLSGVPLAPAPVEDPEIRLLGEVMRLPPDARRRIVEYAASRSK